MNGLVNLLGAALALTVDLASPEVGKSETIVSGSYVGAAAGWIDVLRDRAVPIERRLELAITDPSFEEWVSKFYSRARARSDAPVPPRHSASPASDPARINLSRGFVALRQGLALLSDEAREVARMDAARADFPTESFTAALTDPQVPEIIGDELALFVEGFAAGVAAALLLESADESAEDLGLADALAEVFSFRMQRVPRLLVLSLAGSNNTDWLREGWRAIVSEADLETLKHDSEAAAAHASNLRRLAGVADG